PGTSLRTFYTTALLIVAAGISLGWLGWKCRRDPGINFLPNDERAEWIVFPNAVDPSLHRVAAMDATFRRAFELKTQPKSARLDLRAAKRVEVKINGKSVEGSMTDNWKDISTIDVLGFVQTGMNVIEARAFNDNAPPAIWLTLTADRFKLPSDRTWDV